MKHGQGQCFYADTVAGKGATLVTIYNENRRVGEGVFWVQGTVAHKMVNGVIAKDELGDKEKARILKAFKSPALPANHTPKKLGPQRPPVTA